MNPEELALLLNYDLVNRLVNASSAYALSVERGKPDPTDGLEKDLDAYAKEVRRRLGDDPPPSQ